MLISVKDCMRGSLAKARVLYAPVEEIGNEDRLLRACRILFHVAFIFFFASCTWNETG